MEIVIADKDKFTKFSSIFRHLPLFMDTVNIHVNTNGIYLQGMDTSQVCLFELRLQDDWFTSYQVEHNVVLGIHCNTFYKVIQCLEDNNQHMKLNYDDGDYLKISLEGSVATAANKYFELPLIDIDSEMLEIPETDYSVDIEIHSQIITNYINQLMIFDEDFKMNCTQDNIIMKSKSESGSLSIEMTDDNILLYCLEEGFESLDLTFCLTYIKHMCNFSKITKSVVINLKDNTPLRFHQSFDDVEVFEDSKNYLRFYLAPKIED